MRTVIASTVLVLMAAAPAAAEESAPTPAPTAAQGVAVPDFKTKSWIVVDANSGDILAGQDYDRPLPMASTIKTLTSLALLPRLQYDSVYEARPQETLTEGAHVGVLAGSEYSVAQLFHGMLMRSGNDAAVALADAYGYQRTIDAMNAEAQRVGAASTVAKSPNGLDQPGQVSTAKDLAQIYRVAIEDPRLQEILTAKQAEFPGKAPENPTKARNTFTIYNHDALLTSDYPGFLGGKSGFTSDAGRTYVAGVDRDGKKYVVALLGIGGGTTETARAVLDWAYSTELAPIGELPTPEAAQAIDPLPAGSQTGDDLAAMPLDAETQAQVSYVAQTAQQVAEQAKAVEMPSTAPIAQAAQDAAASALAAAGGTPIDPSQAAVDAQAAVTQALSLAGVASSETPATGTSIGADAIVAGLSQSPFVAPEPAAEVPQERGFFASVFIGLFKAFAWLMLFLGIAVVLLRIRAVRRQKARREAMQRRREEQRQPAGLR